MTILSVANAEKTLIPVLRIPESLIPEVPVNYPFHNLSEAQIDLVKKLRWELANNRNMVQSNKDIPAAKGEKKEEEDYDDDEKNNFITEECLVRFLKATKWNYAEAIDRLRETLHWRREFRPRDESYLEAMKPICAHGGQYLNGFDRLGRPILVNIARLGGSVKDYEASIRFSIYLLEKAIDVMPPGVSQVCVVTEYEGTGMFNSYPLPVTMKYLSILGKHYPELLGACVIVHPSWYIPAFYKLISPFMDPVTKAKIYFATTNEKKEIKHAVGETGGWINLLDIISEDMLPAELGGSFNYTFSFEAYWKELIKKQ